MHFFISNQVDELHRRNHWGTWLVGQNLLPRGWIHGTNLPWVLDGEVVWWCGESFFLATFSCHHCLVIPINYCLNVTAWLSIITDYVHPFQLTIYQFSVLRAFLVTGSEFNWAPLGCDRRGGATFKVHLKSLPTQTRLSKESHWIHAIKSWGCFWEQMEALPNISIVFIMMLLVTVSGMGMTQQNNWIIFLEVMNFLDTVSYCFSHHFH